MVLKNHRSKRQKKSQMLTSTTVVGMDDRLSRLPDALLHHILCLLPMKSVVCMSVLSKRWKYTWTFIPVIDLRQWRSTIVVHKDKEYYDLENERFINFVDKMLSIHDDDMQNIEKFYLKLDEQFDFDESRLNKWVSTVVSRKVEELYLSIYTKCDHSFYDLCLCTFSLSPSLFTCETITTLELEFKDNSLELFHESISFPRLKILRVTNIIFRSENRCHQLFSNSPVLEELCLTHCAWEANGYPADQQAFLNFPVLEKLTCICCSWNDMYHVSISAPALKCLSFDCIGGDSISMLRLSIYAPSLLSLLYKELLASEYVLGSFSSLVDAEIELGLQIESFEEKANTGYAASKFIGALSSVKLLKISGDSFTALSFADDLSTNLPTFHNLIHLEVTSRFPCSIGRILLHFLQFSPSLESLVFNGFDHKRLAGDSWQLNLVAPCFLLHLKSVEFRKFNGNPTELNVVKLFLKCAISMERITIIPNEDRRNKLEKVMDKLLMFPRCSTSCVINFST